MGLKWSERRPKLRTEVSGEVQLRPCPCRDEEVEWVSLVPLSVGSANESESLNQNPWPLIKLFTTPEKEKNKNSLPKYFAPYLTPQTE